MSQLLLWRAQSQALGNIACVNRDSCGMTSGVPISSIERRDQRRRKRQVRVFKAKIGVREAFCESPLILVEEKGTLCSECRSQEKRQGPGRHLLVTHHSQGHNRSVER